MKKDLLTVFHYFGYFSYAPSFDEIYLFYPRKVTKKELFTSLTRHLKVKKIVQLVDMENNIPSLLSYCSKNIYLYTPKTTKYTLPQYSIQHTKIVRNRKVHKQVWAVKTIQKYIQVLHMFPGVQFVGVTGKSALQGLRRNDDLDLCIITQSHGLWTTRFVAVILAKLLGIHGKLGICLNLFFDEDELSIPSQKHNSYVAHEILQMKPLIDKNNTYSLFLSKNKWIYVFFPNAQKLAPKRQSTITGRKIHFLFWGEGLFKAIQLPIIRRNRTGFSLSKTQLWLFKNDFEKKLKRAGLML